jgi:hypothetical protein
MKTRATAPFRMPYRVPFAACLLIFICLLAVAGSHGASFAAAERDVAAQALSSQLIASDAYDSLRPQIAADAAHNLHAVWFDASDPDNPQRGVMYSKGTRTTGGYTWSAPVYVFKPGGFSNFIHPRLAVDEQNRVHAVWTWNFEVYYRHWPASGMPNDGIAAVKLAGGAEYASVATDANGRAHVVYQSNVGDYDIYYRVSDGGANFAAAVDIANDSTNSLSPDIAVDSNGVVHAVWYDNAPGSPRIYHARRTASGWQQPTSVSGSYSYFPSIVADRQGCVHLTWGVTLSTDPNAYYRRSCNGVWETAQALGPSSEARTTVATTPTGNVVAVWEHRDPISTLFYRAFDGTKWTAGQRLTTSAGGRQMWPDAAGMVNGSLAVIWQEDRPRSGGGVQFDPVMALVELAPPLSGSLVLNNGAAFTNSPAVQARITNTSSTVATTYSLADGVDPGTPTTAFSNPAATVAFNLNVGDGRCRAHTVYGRLGSAGAVSPMFAASIVYDPSVSAIAQARNPDSQGNQTLDDFRAAAVPGGDLAYTRKPWFNFSLAPSSEECSGLKRYAVVPQGSALADSDWKTVLPDGFVSQMIQLMSDSSQPIDGQAYRFDVYAEDKAGNSTPQPYPIQIMYDSTPPTISGVSGELPTSSSPRGGVATINIGTPTISDNVYTDPASGQKYWGYWVVVKRSDAGAPLPEEWNAWGVIRTGTLPSSLHWNMADGMVGTWSAFVPNTSYTVYLRVLDGAGNGSNTIASQSVQVKNLEFFTQLPLVRR